MVLRVIPWPLPMIPGQATNENPGGETPGPSEDVTYIEASGIYVRGIIRGNDKNPSYKPDVPKNAGLELIVSGLTVMDVTGVSVIESFEWNAGHAENNYSGTLYEIDLTQGKKVYSVGSEVNRNVKLNGFVTGKPEDKSSYLMELNQKVSTGKFTLKVVNSNGITLQTVTKDFEIKIGGTKS